VTPIDISFEDKGFSPWPRLALLATVSLAFAMAFDVWDSARTGRLQEQATMEARRDLALREVRRAQASAERQEQRRLRQENYPWHRIFAQLESLVEEGVSLSSATHDRISGRTRITLQAHSLEQLEKMVRHMASRHDDWRLERIEIVDRGSSDVYYQANLVADRALAHAQP
jgi:hypothetical protein